MDARMKLFRVCTVVVCCVASSACGGSTNVGSVAADGGGLPDRGPSDAAEVPQDGDGPVRDRAEDLDLVDTEHSEDSPTAEAPEVSADASNAGPSVDAAKDAPGEACGSDNSVDASVAFQGCVVADLPDLWARRLAHDASRRRLYVSVGGASTSFPNTVAVIDPQTGALLSTIPIGSEPMPLALSEDNSTLWVGLNGSFGFRKVTLATTPVVGPVHQLGMDSQRGAYFVATSIVALPGQANSVAIAMSAGGGGDVRVFDDGTPRPVAVDGTNTAATSLFPGPSAYLFGSALTSISVLTVSATGIIQTNIAGFGTSSTIAYAGERIYLQSGKVADVSDPTMPKPAGQIPFEGPLALRDPRRLLMLTNDYSTFPMPPPRLRVLDTSTGTEIASVLLPADTFSFGRTVREFAFVGGDAVAFVLSDSGLSSRLVIFRSSAVAQ
jgi:hypothetical protein